MRVGSKVAIYSIIKKANGPKGQFYVAKFVEMINNLDRGTPNKWESSIQQVLINTDLELEAANFDLEEDKKNKYAFKNISNPDKSIIRVEDFEVTFPTVWHKGKQKFTENRRPAVKTVYIIHKCSYDKGYKSENRKLWLLKHENDQLRDKIERLKILNSELRYKAHEIKRQVQYRDKLVEKEKKRTEKAQKRLKTAQELAKTPKIVERVRIETKIVEKTPDEPIIRFEDI